MKVTVKIDRSDDRCIDGKLYLGIYTASYHQVLQDAFRAFCNTHLIVENVVSYDDGTNEAFVDFTVNKFKWHKNGGWCIRRLGSNRLTSATDGKPLCKVLPFAEALDYGRTPEVSADKFMSLISKNDFRASDARKILNWIFKAYKSGSILSKSHAKKIDELITFSSSDEPGDPKLFGEAPNPLQYELNLSCAEKVRRLQEEAAEALHALNSASQRKLEFFSSAARREAKAKRTQIRAECRAKIKELRKIQADAYSLK